MYKDFLEIPLAQEWWFIVAFVWVFVWKGLALWKSARLGAKWWFIAMLVINTLGVLEILYLFVFSKHKSRTKMHSDDKEYAHSTLAEAPAEAASPEQDPPRNTQKG